MLRRNENCKNNNPTRTQNDDEHAHAHYTIRPIGKETNNICLKRTSD